MSYKFQFIVLLGAVDGELPANRIGYDKSEFNEVLS